MNRNTLKPSPTLDEAQIISILERLNSEEAAEAWASFLRSFSPLILQVIKLHESDIDSVGDCYLYVCEQLSRNRFKRLCRYQPAGKASFATWLRAVVWNLCVDWRRKKYGRNRLFESVRRLPALEQEIFHCIYLRGMSSEESFRALSATYRHLEMAEVDAVRLRLESMLTPRQRWILSTEWRESQTEPGTSGSEDDELDNQVPDSRLNPEMQILSHEEQRTLERIMTNLPPQELLFIRLRFEQGLTLEKIAELTGANNAQAVDRRIRSILDHIREQLKG